MNAKLATASRSPILTISAATAAAVVALSILWSVVFLFESKGAPMERLVAAERACLHHAYQSDREACMKQWLADSQSTNLANH